MFVTSHTPGLGVVDSKMNLFKLNSFLLHQAINKYTMVNWELGID